MEKETNSTFSAVIRSSSDSSRVLAESNGWHTYKDASTLGLNEVFEQWRWQVHGILCIEERK